MTTVHTESLEHPTRTGSERRREVRADLKFPVEVCGFSRTSRFFSEKTATSDVSDGGCKLHLRTEVEKGSVLAVRVITRRFGLEVDARPMLFQVNWIRAAANGWDVGIAKLQPGKIWNVSFELPNENPVTVS
jgi:PilZ domain